MAGEARNARRCHERTLQRANTLFPTTGANTQQTMSRPSVAMVRRDTEHVEHLSVHWRHLAVRFHEIQALSPCSGDVEAWAATKHRSRRRLWQVDLSPGLEI